jgi:hypothetical protein
MSIKLPVHYTDLVYKDPDGAVCACMSRDRLEASSADLSAQTATTASTIGRIGCGMRCYSPLGTEMWGRSLLVFHSFDLATITPSPGLRILRLAQGARTGPEVVELTTERVEDPIPGRDSSQSTISIPSECGTLRHESSHDIDTNKKRKSEDPETDIFP